MMQYSNHHDIIVQYICSLKAALIYTTELQHNTAYLSINIVISRHTLCSNEINMLKERYHTHTGQKLLIQL
jgi:hypothetical protein